MKTRSSTSSAAGNGAIVTTTALGPAKHRAVGGGFQQSVPTAGAIGLVYESAKSGQGGWRASAQVLDQIAPIDVLSLTSYVYCRKITSSKKTGVSTPPKTSATTTTVPAPDANQTGPTAQAICGGGRSAMAGGFATSPPVIGGAARPIVLDSTRSGSLSWQTLVLSGAHAGTVTSRADCAKAKAPSRANAASPFSTTAFEIRTATATCTPKTRPVHGGFTQTGATPNNLMLIYESQAAGNGWRVSASHLGTASSNVGAAAYCG